MYRILPLFLLLTACAGDPLDVTIVDLADTDSVTDGLTTIDYDITSPLTGEHELLASHEDLTLKFSFRTTVGTDATLSLQGQYPFALADMSLSGQQPRITANPSPGIWHDLELIYKAATETTPAILSSAYLDGNLLHFQQELPTSTASAGPLRLEVKSGSLELDDLRYTDVAGTVSYVNDAGEVELSIPLIHYAYYELEDGVKEVKNWAQLTPKKTGYLDRFDLGTIR
ncbi:MAG: hypothetical protein AAFN92_09300 [Bacteroidota bacterium]